MLGGSNVGDYANSIPIDDSYMGGIGYDPTYTASPWGDYSPGNGSPADYGGAGYGAPSLYSSNYPFSSVPSPYATTGVGGADYSSAGTYLPGGTYNLPTPDEIAAAGNIAGSATGPAGSYPVPGQYNYPDPGAIPAGQYQGAPPSYPVNSANMAPVASGPATMGPTARFLPPVLGIAGGFAGAALGGPIGALAGRVGGNLLGRFLANGGLGNLNLQTGGYNPRAPISLSNVPPFGGPAAADFRVLGMNGNVAYQQSGDIMDRSRGGYDPSAVMFNPIRPFGPGNYNPGRSFNQSSGYVGSGIAQGDAMQQAHLMARSAEGGADRELNDTLPAGFPIANLTGPAGAAPVAAAPVFGVAGIPNIAALLGLPTLSGDVISTALPPKP